MSISQPVWFFLLEVEVTGNSKQPWIAGSTAMLQVFVPGRALEASLELLDAFLPTEELRRVDTLRAVRYDPGDDDADFPGEYFSEPLFAASQRNECVLGIFIVSKDTAFPHVPLPDD